MTAKQVFLKRIKDKLEASENEVKTYKELLLQNEKLPDSFFEGLIDVPSAPPQQNLNNQGSIRHFVESIGDYGRNKRLVIEILSKEGKAMLKSDIVSKFEALTGEQDATNIVTNAMAALSSIDKALKGFKLDGVRVRGYYWALTNWMNGDNIKPEYAPDPMSPIGKYLFTS